MKVFDPGHLYELAQLDYSETTRAHKLQFVKRIGEKFPGNVGESYPGTTTQEVIRALIDRMKYVDGQEPGDENQAVLLRLRQSLWQLEKRANAKRGTRSTWQWSTTCSNLVAEYGGEENVPTCETCGHWACEDHP